MLVELSVVEQRYQAVLAVIRDGVPVVEVASRFGVSRQAVHRCQALGMATPASRFLAREPGRQADTSAIGTERKVERATMTDEA